MHQAPPSTSSAPATGTWRTLVRHPVFPLIALLLLTQIVRDDYPISHYPMYSQPVAADGNIRFHYVGDAGGKPLPTTLHAGVTPSQVGKRYNRQRADLLAAEEKRTHQELVDFSSGEGLAIETRAGGDTLEWIRRQSQSPNRPKERQLNQAIRLYEVEVGASGGSFVENTRVIAELAAQP